jgi:hypothetical protein
MFDACTRPVSDDDMLRLLDSLIRSERTSSVPTVFDASNPCHREALDRGLAVARPWPLTSKGEPERQCLLVSVTTGWKWMRSHRSLRRATLAQQRRPAIWPIQRRLHAYVCNTF